MTKTNLILAAALAVLLAACSKPDADAPAATTDAPAAEATDVATDATDGAVEAADAAAPADAVAGSDLPQACTDYLARARACFEQAGGNAAVSSFQQGVDMAEAEWSKVADKTALASACDSANQQFAAAASALQCE